MQCNHPVWKTIEQKSSEEVSWSMGGADAARLFYQSGFLEFAD